MLRKSLIEYLQLLAIGAALGWLFSQAWLGALVASAIYIGILLRRLGRVEQAIRGDSALAGARPSPAPGLGERLHDNLREQSRHRYGMLRQIAGARRLLNKIPEPILILNLEHDAIWFNTASAAVLRLRYPNDRGVSALTLVHSSGLEQALIDLGPGAPHRELTVELSNAPQALYRMHLHYLGHDRRLMHLQDVSEREGLAAAHRKLIANFSHEIKTPLTLMQGYVDIIDEKAGAEQQPLARIRDLIARINRFAEDSIARLRASLEQAEPRLPVVDFDIAAWFQGYIEECEGSGQLHHPISADIEPGLSVFGREGELVGIFSNLLNNARQHTPRGTAISVKAYGQYEDVVFEVADEGPGIPEHEIDHLTEMFYRHGDRLDKAEQSGAGHGMGLAIVEGLLRRCRGKLDIQSSLGKGSVFRCRIPARSGDIAVSAPQEPGR